MKPKQRNVLVHFIWAVAGVAAGATVALLWVKGLRPEWIEATGTWFAAIATVLTLLWAVQTFRTDQAHRDAERHLAEAARVDAHAKEQAEVRADASHVAIALRGGGGSGQIGEKSMTGVFVDIHNDTDEPVIEKSIALETLKVRSSFPTPIRIKPQRDWREHFDIDPAPVSDEELSGHPLVSYGGSMTFEIHDREWFRTTDGQLGETSRGGPA